MTLGIVGPGLEGAGLDEAETAIEGDGTVVRFEDFEQVAVGCGSTDEIEGVLHQDSRQTTAAMHWYNARARVVRERAIDAVEREADPALTVEGADGGISKIAAAGEPSFQVLPRHLGLVGGMA